MSPSRGDIALVYFPHADLHTIKLRPVLIIQADDLNTGLDQRVVAMISSNLQRGAHPSRVTLLLNDPQSSGTGLRLDSIVMTDNLATIELAQFKSTIGHLSSMALVDKALAHTLGMQ